jgi:hypothetical protein
VTAGSVVDVTGAVVTEEVGPVVEEAGRGSVPVVVGRATDGRGTVGSGIVGRGIVVVGSCVAAAGDGSTPRVSHRPKAPAATVKTPATRRASGRPRSVPTHGLSASLTQNLRPVN